MVVVVIGQLMESGFDQYCMNLVVAHLGSPGKRAVKRVCVYESVTLNFEQPIVIDCIATFELPSQLQFSVVRESMIHAGFVVSR